MATTDLKLEETGSLPKPGPIGRVVRLVFGALCVHQAVGLIDVSGDLIGSDGHIRAVVWNGLLIGLFLISYIINIGFSRAWKKWPAILSAGVFVTLAAYGQITQGVIETNALASAIWGWELYLFTHLGIAFILSAVIGTPGCEMRSFHDLYSRLSGNPTKEHYCPVGPLNPIDNWESNRN